MLEGGLGLLLGLAAFLFVVWFYFVLPAQMASTRGRSAFVWVCISLVGSPLLAILLLVALGNAPGFPPALAPAVSE